jgi:hypothetical protein
MKEIAFTVATSDFLNRAYSIPAIPSRPLEQMPEQVHMRLLRPLINRVLQSHRFRGRRRHWNACRLILMSPCQGVRGIADRTSARADDRGDVGILPSHPTLQALNARCCSPW